MTDTPEIPPTEHPLVVPLAPPLVSAPDRSEASGAPVLPPSAQVPATVPTPPPPVATLAPATTPDATFPVPLPAAAPVPPYAVTPATAAPPTPPSSSSRWGPVLIVTLIAVLVLGVLGVATVLIVSGPTSASNEAVPAPGVTDTSDPAPGAETVPDADDAPDEDAVPDENTVSAEASAELTALIDRYRTERDSGELWQKIPDTDFNRTAVAAFLYFLTDMKVGASWGVDDATASGYLDDAAELEQKLLAQEPLGSDITITFSEDEVFRYDGETGEGGYFSE